MTLPSDPDPEPARSAGHAAVAALRAVVRQLPGGVTRPQQEQMAAAVAEAIAEGAIVAVEAPTGVGKSLGYLVPAVTTALDAGADAGDEPGPVVVATATKALQEQLVTADLPRVAAVRPLTWAVAKGRANYLCAARLDALRTGEEPLFDERVDGRAWDALVGWAEETEDGDRAHAPDGVTDALWSQVSVSASECPGARRCAFGDVCFAEHAKARAHTADVVVTNQHLLLLDAAFEGALLPEASAAVVDEAHRLVDTAGSVFGCALAPGRLRWLARRARPVAGDEPTAGLAEAADVLATALERCEVGARVDVSVGPLATALATVDAAVSGVCQALRGLADDAHDADADGPPDAAGTRRSIVVGAAATLLAEVVEVREHDPDRAVCWIELAERGERRLRLAPIEVDQLLRRTLVGEHPVVLTSATLSVGGELQPTLHRWGLDAHATRTVQVDSPFDHRRQGLLFVPRHLPDPRHPEWEGQARSLTLRLLQAAGGRSLVLFTSWQRLHDTADWLADQLPWQLLRQGEAPPNRLTQRFLADERSVLCATMSFWEGVDAPGRACVQVIIDKLPFPRRDDPLLAARREKVEASGGSAFAEVDLPIAAVRLAQGVGRLIRSDDDVGVVAVLDRRLAAAGYRRALLDSMPPLRRTVDEADVAAFLADRLGDGQADAAAGSPVSSSPNR